MLASVMRAYTARVAAERGVACPAARAGTHLNALPYLGPVLLDHCQLLDCNLYLVIGALRLQPGLRAHPLDGP